MNMQELVELIDVKPAFATWKKTCFDWQTRKKSQPEVARQKAFCKNCNLTRLKERKRESEKETSQKQNSQHAKSSAKQFQKTKAIQLGEKFQFINARFNGKRDAGLMNLVELLGSK